MNRHHRPNRPTWCENGITESELVKAKTRTPQRVSECFLLHGRKMQPTVKWSICMRFLEAYKSGGPSQHQDSIRPDSDLALQPQKSRLLQRTFRTKIAPKVNARTHMNSQYWHQHHSTSVTDEGGKLGMESWVAVGRFDCWFHKFTAPPLPPREKGGKWTDGVNVLVCGIQFGRFGQVYGVLYLAIWVLIME